MEKKLYRNMQNKMLTGVCAGVADYFDLDVTLIRVLVALGALFVHVFVIVAYIIMAFVIPEKPVEEKSEETPVNNL